MAEEQERDNEVVVEPDPYENDRFFKRVFDGQWNACIGRQGHEGNYIDGYIDAAIELADAIFEKKMFAKRDNSWRGRYSITQDMPSSSP